MDKDKQEILTRVLSLLKTIGSANDAEDHGFFMNAEQMRKESCQELHDLLSEHEFLIELLPRLREELDSQRILWIGWLELSAIIEGKLNELNRNK